MKTSRVVGIIIFTCLLLPFIVPSAPSRAQTIRVRVGVYDMPPKIFKENGNWAGFWYDITNYIGKREGWSIEYIEGTWTEGMDRLDAGEIDVMVDVAFSKERNLIFDFNNVTVYSNWGVIYAREHGLVFDFDDLNGKTIAVMNNSIHTNGTYGIANITNYFGINCSFMIVQDYTEVFEMVHNGMADVGAVNRLFGLLNQDEYGLVETSLFFNPSDLMFAFPKNAFLNDILVQRIDVHLAELKDDPDSIYYQSIEHHFMGVAVVERIPDWLVYLITTVIFIGVVFVVMSAYLKRKVQQRTADLREVNERLELVNKILLSTIPSGVLLVDSDGEIILANNSFHKMYSKVHDGALDTSSNIFNTPDNILSRAIKDIIKDASNHEKTSPPDVGLKKQMITVEPSIHLEVFSSIISIQRTGQNSGILVIFNDVSPFVELEKTRQHFVSMVSHELSTPLTAINLALYNVIKYRKSMEEVQLEKTLVTMQRNGNLLSMMLEDLLVAARIEAASFNIQKKTCNISEIIGKIIQELEHRILEKQLTINLEIDNKIEILVDNKRISQAFRIIIENTVKYSHQGTEVKVIAIDNFTGPENPSAVPGILVKVIDHGIGIPKNDLPCYSNDSTGARTLAISMEMAWA
nr:transporter substrate-binding domain-containing protein [Candidatus Sigynarchaeota archaeon]